MRRRVVVLGGGVAGLSVAQELTEGERGRRFSVEVIERAGVLGGKARSATIERPPGSGLHYPSEHGFRFFPAYYRHVVDTMARIPDAGGERVSDHLAPAERRLIARYDRPPLEVPSAPSFSVDYVRAIADLLLDLGTIDVLPDDRVFFAERIWQLLTSCKDRRVLHYDDLTWWDFVGAASRNEAFRTYLAGGLTRTLVAAKPDEISVKTGGDVLVRILLDTLFPGAESRADRVLDGPTSEVWIAPWRAELERRGVVFRTGVEVEGFRMTSKRIRGVVVRDLATRRSEIVKADAYVSALPVDRMGPLVTDDMIRVDRRLAPIRDRLQHDVAWMSGFQLYLDHPVEIVPGHALYVDSHWSLTTISQLPFWRPAYAAGKGWGGGRVRGVISGIISDWESPGLSGRRADESTREEIMEEALAQLRKSLNAGGVVRLPPGCVIDGSLDDSLTPADPAAGRPRALNAEPLFVNKAGAHRLRPEAHAPCSIPNLFLASDYVRTNTDLASMESANEAARRAVNALLASAGVSADPCEIWDPFEFSADDPASWVYNLRRLDQARFDAGLPWRSPDPAPPG